MYKLKKSYNIMKNSKVKNSLIDYYLNIFSSIFIWEGLPDTINLDYFNKSIFFTGKACFFKKDNNIYSLGYESGGERNIYGEDIKGIAVGFGQTFPQLTNWTTGTRQEVECIPFYDTSSKKTPFQFIDILVEKMTDILRSQDIQIILSKKPFIVDVDENNISNIKNLFSDFDSNMPFIIGSDVLGKVKSMEVFPLPNNLDKIKLLNEEFLNVDNLIRKYLGIYNSENNDKKERLIVDEINANNSITNLILEDRLKQRLLFCDKVNKVFNLDIKVKVNNSVRGENDGINNIQKVARE